jgi:hypothetical protein
VNPRKTPHILPAVLVLTAGALALSVALPAPASAGASSRATWYSPGLGACGPVNGDGELVAALSPDRFDLRWSCGQRVRISAGGKTIVARVHDLCSTCPRNDLDLSPDAFAVLAPLETGSVEIQWTFVERADPQPSSTITPTPTPSRRSKSAVRPPSHTPTATRSGEQNGITTQ